MAITPQQAAAMGKGWVDKYNPHYGTAGFVGPEDESDYVAPPSSAPTSTAPTTAPNPVLTATSTTAPTPSAPKPGPDWVPTADGQGWLPPDRAGSAQAWTPPAPIEPAAPAAAPTTPAGGPAPPAQPPVDVAPGVPAAPAGPPATVNDAYKKALMDAISKPIGIDQNDPVMKGQREAFSLAQTRAKQRDREAMASRAGASGQISDLATGGAFDEGLSNLEQRQGEAESLFDANLAGTELTKQRDDLYRYMALAGNTLSAEEARALTEKLANLEAQIKREGMTQQGSQFSQDLDLRKLLGEAGIDVQKLGINTQGGLGSGDLALRDKLGSSGLNLQLLQLLTGNQQFGQNLGAQLGMFGANQDADLWKLLLGGMS